MADYTVPSSGSKYVGLAEVVRIKGVDTIRYAAMRELSFSWGNQVDMVDIIGSDIPVQLTGPFRGSGRGELVVSSDLFTNGAGEGELLSLSSPDPSTGQLPEVELRWRERDLQSPQKTSEWTLKVRLTSIEKSRHAERGYHIASVGFVLADRPSVVVY